uniref:Uncharacterized protein n=1 Tax=Molossus molossus TaxID=27622 RepID=A0A7J8FS96_MOLMO|nr:hypothetical protein HJG59_008345 [Molossus molossus]
MACSKKVPSFRTTSGTLKSFIWKKTEGGVLVSSLGKSSSSDHPGVRGSRSASKSNHRSSVIAHTAVPGVTPAVTAPAIALFLGPALAPSPAPPRLRAGGKRREAGKHCRGAHCKPQPVWDRSELQPRPPLHPVQRFNLISTLVLYTGSWKKPEADSQALGSSPNRTPGPAQAFHLREPASCFLRMGAL